MFDMITRRPVCRNLVALLVVLGLAYASLFVVGTIHLVVHYGLPRVWKEHLWIVRIKPSIVVSNGDVFSTWESSLNFMTTGVLWLLVVWWIAIPLLNHLWKIKRERI